MKEWKEAVIRLGSGLRETSSVEWEACLCQWKSLLRVRAADPQEEEIFPHLIPHTEHLSMTASNMPMNKNKNILLIGAT